MKIINSIIGILIIFLGCTLMNIAVFNEEFKILHKGDLVDGNKVSNWNFSI